MGAGIAVQFTKKYPFMKEYLIKNVRENNIKGPYVIEYDAGDRMIFNMITKKNSYGKPTYETFEKSLDDLVIRCREFGVKKLAIPKIGCGLDRLSWNVVRDMIEDKFNGLDIEILVCYL
jgi:hypothetical protein